MYWGGEERRRKKNWEQGREGEGGRFYIRLTEGLRLGWNLRLS